MNFQRKLFELLAIEHVRLKKDIRYVTTSRQKEIIVCVLFYRNNELNRMSLLVFTHHTI